MPKGKAASSSDSNSPLRPPTSLEAQENLMISWRFNVLKSSSETELLLLTS